MKFLLCENPALNESIIARVRAGELPRHTLMGYDVMLQSGVECLWIPQCKDVLETYQDDPEAILIDSYPGISIENGWKRSWGKSRLRVLSMFHGSFDPGRLRWLRYPYYAAAIRGLDTIISLSKNTARNLIRYGARKPEYVCWGADLGFYQYHPQIGEWFLATGRTGRDFATVIKAAILAEVPIHIHCSDPSAIEMPAELPSNIKVLKAGDLQLPQDEFTGAFATIIPTYGGTSLNGLTSLNEALALGRPVIMTKMSHISIDPVAEKVGYTVPAGDVNALAEAMRKLWRERALAQEMGQRARALAEDSVNYENFCGRINGILERTYGISKHR